MSFPKLSACAVNIPTHFPSNCNIDSVFFKLVFKHLHVMRIRRHKITFLDRIDWDQIDMTAYTFASAVSCCASSAESLTPFTMLYSNVTRLPVF